MKIYWINGFESGNLGMMTRPRGNDWLEDEVKKMRLYGVDAVVSLLEKSEVNELELQDEDELCFNHGIDLIQFPIEDTCVPEDNLSFVSLIRKIEQRLQEDKKVVIHCRMGIGRTGMVAAGVLIRNGGEVNEVFQRLSQIRTLEVPDTEEQIQWLERQVKELRKG